MSTVVCPLINNPYYSYSIDLDQETYTLTFRYNERAESYELSIEDAEENLIVANVMLVPGYPLLDQYRLDNPVGVFFLVPYEQETIFNDIPDPRRIDKTHFLIYYSGVDEDA